MTDHLLAIVDEHTGNLLVDTTDTMLSDAMHADLAESMGDGAEFGCAKPRVMQAPPEACPPYLPGARISGYWHDSLVEGPGRRSVVRFQGCPIRCHGCWVPETWDPTAGTLVAIDVIASLLLDPCYARDGVTILGGEPFAQLAGLSSLIGELRGRQADLHITVYTGFTFQSLIRRNDPDVNLVLGSIDVLIDGKYIAALAHGAGAWTGSSNQRVIHLI